ncbi:MAG: hypothetical protein WA139_02765 [Candidatus Aenigmatarchaeota archaeon]
MLEQELSMDCPFCEKAKIKVRHKPSVISTKTTRTATMGAVRGYHQSKETYDVLEDCPNCHKTKEEIKKRLIEGKPMDREAVIKRMRDMGLDPAKVKL